MNKLSLTMLCQLALLLPSFGQIQKEQLVGAWRLQSDGNIAYTTVAIISTGHYAISQYKTDPAEFISTRGGSWQLEDNIFTETIEFNTADTSQVGQSIRNGLTLSNGNIQVVATGQVWTRVDDGTEGPLAGGWLITGRKRNGEMTRRTPGPRKTMKILSGTRFQWIAYNVQTKQFFGTGGGTYSGVDDQYVENIEFFSRDNSRTGASLSFTYEIIDGEWHHSGLSSKGKPIYEIWTLR